MMCQIHKGLVKGKVSIWCKTEFWVKGIASMLQRFYNVERPKDGEVGLDKKNKMLKKGKWNFKMWQGGVLPCPRKMCVLFLFVME